MSFRIQRQRKRGWIEPLGAAFVGKGSPWATPFKVIGTIVYGNASHQRREGLDPYIFISNHITNEEAKYHAMQLYQDWINRKVDKLHIIPCPFTKDDVIRELKGRILTCYCKEEAHCHGDVLIRIANE